MEVVALMRITDSAGYGDAAARTTGKSCLRAPYLLGASPMFNMHFSMSVAALR